MGPSILCYCFVAFLVNFWIFGVVLFVCLYRFACNSVVT